MRSKAETYGSMEKTAFKAILYVGKAFGSAVLNLVIAAAAEAVVQAVRNQIEQAVTKPTGTGGGDTTADRGG